MARNQRIVAEWGRDPAARLDRCGSEPSPAQWGAELLEQCEPIAEALDAAHGGGRYAQVLAAAQRGLREPASLPSARVLQETETSYAKSYPRFVLAWSRRHRDELCALPLAPQTEERYAMLAAQSLAEQARIEDEDREPFEAYRRRYLEQDLLSGPHVRAS